MKTKKNINYSKNLSSIKKIVNTSLVFHNLNKYIEQKLNISLVQYHFLSILKEMPTSSPNKVARAAGMHPSTLTQTLKRLSKRGLIYIDEHPKDSRKKILILSKKGKTALDLFDNEIENSLNMSGKLMRWIQTFPQLSTGDFKNTLV